jgi:hypothetical protein
MIFASILDDVGSLLLAAVAFAVFFYLLYALAHPERF